MRVSIREQTIYTYIEKKVQIKLLVQMWLMTNIEHVAGLPHAATLYIWYDMYMHGSDFCVFILFKRTVASSLLDMYTKESAIFRLKIDIWKIENNYCTVIYFVILRQLTSINVNRRHRFFLETSIDVNWRQLASIDVKHYKINHGTV